MKLRSFSNAKKFENALNYFDRDDATDKTLLKSIPKHIHEQDTFEKMIVAQGSCGGFDAYADKNKIELVDDYKKYRPTQVWTNVISLTKEDARQFGLLNKKDFAAITNQSVIDICRELHIDIADVKWCGFYHINTDHPHIHFYMYDKTNRNNAKLLNKAQINVIRSRLANRLLDRSELFNQKELASKGLIKNVNEQYFMNEMRFSNFKGNVNKDIKKQMNILIHILPVTGRMSYHSENVKPYKQEIDKLITMILETPTFKNDFRVFLKCIQEIDVSNLELYGVGKKENRYQSNQLDKIYSVIGNGILKSIKLYRKQIDNELGEIKNVTVSEARKLDNKLKKIYSYHLLRYSFSMLQHELSAIKRYHYLQQESQRKMQKSLEQDKENKREDKEH